MQEQQQEAGGCKVLQLPGPEEAAGGGAGPGGAVQRHHRDARTSLPHHLEKHKFTVRKRRKENNSTLYRLQHK